MFIQRSSEEIKELRQNNPWLGSFVLSDDDFCDVFFLSSRTLIGSDTLDVFYDKMFSTIKKDRDTVLKIIAAVVTNRLYSNREEISGFEEFVKKIGWQPPAPKAPKESPESFVGKILLWAKINFPDHVEQSRLEFILISFVKKERTLDEVKAALARPRKVGGMEMEPEEIEQIVNLFIEKLKIANVEIPERKAPVVADIKPPSIRPVPTTSALPPLAKGRVGEGSQSTKPVFPSPSPPPSAPPFVPALESAPHPIVPSPSGQRGVPNSPLSPLCERGECVETVVKRIEEAAGLKFDEDKRKKFTTAVEARLKDVRDAFETRDLLERPIDQGGLAISGGQLVKVVEELEKVVGEQQAVARRKTEGEKESARAAKIVAEKTVAEKTKAVKPKFVPPKPATPVVSPASRPAQTNGVRPIVTDVVAPSRRLSGPIDELQNLSLNEFRRLSSDPKEAIIKIHDKINLLEEQGVGQKILAVKAWRSAPVNLLYLEISRAALLAGRTIEEIAREREAAGQTFLSGVEIQAINSLNGMLRF